MAQTVELRVGMSCQGCVGAVTRVLTKLEGVESYDVDIKAQKVTVKTNLEPHFVLEKVSKSGKKTEFWKDEVPAALDAETTEAPITKENEAVTAVAEKETEGFTPGTIVAQAPASAISAAAEKEPEESTPASVVAQAPASAIPAAAEKETEESTPASVAPQAPASA